MFKSLLLASTVFASPLLAESVNMNGYSALLDSTRKDIKSGKALTEIAENAKTLVKLSRGILTNFGKSEPACKTYLEAALKAASLMMAADLETIERDYHHDKALPKAPKKCYQVKDLLVHPATVYVLAQKHAKDQSVRGKMGAELAELTGHLAYVKMLVSPKK